MKRYRGYKNKKNKMDAFSFWHVTQRECDKLDGYQ